MFSIEDMLSGDFSKYTPEEQEYMKAFTEKLREKIKEELTKELAVRMLKDIDRSNETFMNVLSEILENGCKGFNKMSTRTLLNVYLEKKTQEDFFNLLDHIEM